MGEAHAFRRTSGMAARSVRCLVALPPTASVLVFFAAPVLLFAASFLAPGDFGGLAAVRQDGRWAVTLDAHRFPFSDWIYAEIFLRSFLVAALTTMLCLVLATRSLWPSRRVPGVAASG